MVKEPCYIAGNSLGGFLATAVAATHPDLIKGVILWNATPFWSFAPNRKGLSEWVKRTIVPYDGTLPAPAPNFKIGSTWFDGLKNPVTVRSMLSGALRCADGPSVSCLPCPLARVDCFRHTHQPIIPHPHPQPCTRTTRRGTSGW